MEVKDWIENLALTPHPEGGYYRQTILSSDTQGERPNYSSIYFLLEDTNISHFHQIDADEIWYFHAGVTLTIHMIHPDHTYETMKLGLNVDQGEVLQYVVPKHTIFASSIEESNAFAVVGCMVQPAFQFEHFKLYTQAELLAEYPEHEDVIRRYAKES
ncbi:cupin domain-containing protein [Staphylococcus americanisciuri]|uniref:Cupin domain-containing protein n=1 Tax=Staphylococcus americanisciuri TaxID=2973940 RepID=A0ABT2F1Y4_9STAP|nr:cupin domain-containing protein [Staphylococcus americanisciuri]MCS4486459.1 cupin domain-containing protein [Staphylococcus americanisciuri]